MVFRNVLKKPEDSAQTAKLKLREKENKQQVEENLPSGHNNEWTARVQGTDGRKRKRRERRRELVRM